MHGDDARDNCNKAALLEFVYEEDGVTFFSGLGDVADWRDNEEPINEILRRLETDPLFDLWGRMLQNAWEKGWLISCEVGLQPQNKAETIQRIRWAIGCKDVIVSETGAPRLAGAEHNCPAPSK